MTDMQWRTGIAQVTTDDVIIRGHRLSELIGSVTYVDMAFLLIRGDAPSDAERAMLDAILVCLADHGISPTAIVARTLTSCGTPIQASLAGAMLSIADWHGGSGEEVGQILETLIASASVSASASASASDSGSDADAGADAGGVAPTAAQIAARCQEFVAGRQATREQVPGFGHPQHTDGDPRAIQLLGLAESLGTAGVFCATLDTLGEALGAATGRANLSRPNVLGAQAAILLDLGFPWQAIRGIVIAARSIGLTAHVVEELAQGNRWRHAPADTVEYTGAPASA